MNLSQLLKQAVSSPNAVQQKEAEQKLIACLASNSEQFILSLAHIVGSDEQNDIVRQAAGTVISRNIFTYTEDGTQYKWHTYDKSVTQQIKNILLATLGSEKDLAKRSASDAISKIAAVDIPLSRWSQLIPALLNAAGNQQIRNKKTAIMALGFVCIQFKQHKIAITHTQTEQIFSAIYLGLTDSNIDVKKQSLIALAPCIIYITQILKNQKFREKTILILLQCLQIQALIQQTLQVFIQYAKHYYAYLGQINENLYNITATIIERKDQYSVSAMELWHTVAEQYNENKHTAGIQNYIKLLGDKIVKLLLTNLLFVTKDDDNNIRQAAYNTLIPICECSQQTSIESVTLFVSNGLASQDWKFRQATVMAFSTLCGSENKTIKQWLDQAYDQFFSLLNDQDQFVIQSTLIGLHKIFETDTNSLILLKKKIYKNYINVLTSLLNRNENITVKTLEALGKLTQCLAKNTSLDLASNIFDLLNIVTQFIMKTPTPSCRELQSASIIIIHLLQGNKSNKTNKDYAEFMTVEAAKLRQSIQTQNNLKSCLLILLHTAILSGKDQISKQHIQAIISIIQSHFQAISSVDQDGLYIIGALALRTEQNFIPFFPRLSPYITHGLGLKKQPVTYKVCLGVICDVVKSIGQSFPNQIQAYLTCFINEFNSEGDRSSKGPLIAAIGDLIRQCSNSSLINKYLAQIIQIAQTSISACIHLSSTNEDSDYTEELKEILCDFLECLCSGIGKDCVNKVPQILHIGLTFVLHTCSRESNPTLSHFKKGILVLFDIASIIISAGVEYVQLVKTSFSNPQFIAIFNSLKDIPYTDEVKSISNYGKAIFAAIRITTGVKYI